MKQIIANTMNEAKAQGLEIDVWADRVERHFCQCGACKEKTAIDFHVIVWGFKWHNDQMDIDVWEPRKEEYRVNSDGTETLVKNTYIAKCPRCGAEKPKNSELKASKIKHDPNHVCDDRCQKAISDHCTCSCEGKGHGIKNKVEGSLFF